MIFYRCSFRGVVLAQVTSIGAWAFESIQRDPAEFTIYGATGSAAETYANENGHIFIEFSGNEDRSPAVRYLYYGLGLLLVLAGGAFALRKKRKLNL